MNSAEIIKRLTGEGWIRVGEKGDQHGATARREIPDRADRMTILPWRIGLIPFLFQNSNNPTIFHY